MNSIEKIASKIIANKNEAIDCFLKFFIATEIKDIKQLRGRDLVLVETLSAPEDPLITHSYHIEFKKI